MYFFDWIIAGFSVLVFIAGGLTISYQLFYGFSKTGLNDKYIWGLGIQGFFSLSSFASGVLIIVSSFLLLGADYPAQVFRLAVFAALGLLIGSQLLLFADLGRPFRGLNIFRIRNFRSPLTWDIISLLMLTVLCLVFALDLVKTEIFLRIWAGGSLFFALFSLAVHSLFFISRVEAGFNSQPFGGAKGFAYSFWSGGALLSLFAYGDPSHSQFMGLLLIFTFLVSIVSAGALISGKLGQKEYKDYRQITLSFVILLLLMGEGILLMEVPLLQNAIALLVLVAVFFEKYEMIVGYQRKPIIPYPYSKFERTPPYRPSFVEWASLAGAVSCSILVFYGMIILHEYIIPVIHDFLG